MTYKSFMVKDFIWYQATPFSLVKWNNVVKLDKNVLFICSDILNFTSDKKFDIWHDRAVFHFLLTKVERTQYFETLIKHLKKEGIAFISTFTTHGDISCAGLDTVQYDKEKMLQELPLGLKLVESNEFLHRTPKDTIQKYISFVIEKV